MKMTFKINIIFFTVLFTWAAFYMYNVRLDSTRLAQLKTAQLLNQGLVEPFLMDESHHNTTHSKT